MNAATPVTVLVLWGCVGALATGQTNSSKPGWFDGPAVISHTVPKYPPIAVTTCVQGRSAIVVDLDAAGRVVAADTIYAPKLLQAAVEDAVHLWRFEPAPSSDRRRQVIRFTFVLKPRRTSARDLEPLWKSTTEAEVRSKIGEVSCSDCSAAAWRLLNREWEKACLSQK